MNLEYVSIGRNPPEELNAIIEVPIDGEPIKYEMDKKAGTLVVDPFLYTPVRYPGNYGFIPHTLSEDGYPCDILVANTRPIIPGAVIAVRPIGVLKVTDEGAVTRRLSPRRFRGLRNATPTSGTIPICRKSLGARSSTSSHITRTSKPANG